MFKATELQVCVSRLMMPAVLIGFLVLPQNVDIMTLYAYIDV